MRTPTNRKQGVGYSIFSMDVSHPVIPNNPKEYYKWAEYFFTYTVVGEALTKKAQYAVSNIYISSPDSNNKSETEKIIRKMKLREKMLAAGINYQVFGVSYIVPMFPIRKTLQCPTCKTTYNLKNLAKGNKPLYTYESGHYRYSCDNEECPDYGVLQKFHLEETEINDINSLSLAVWQPYFIDVNENEITGQKEWLYTIPPATGQKIKDRDHFIMCSTPQIYIDAVLNKTRIRINSDKIFVFEAPTLKKNGLPIPPMVRAFQGLYLHSKFQEANKVITEDSLTPMRVLFPLGSTGRPLQNTIKTADWKAKVNQELKKWRDDKTYVPILPVEIGTKNIWGDGKLLVLDSQMRSAITDILANVGAPIEFVYGGAAWSRQNVSALILENSFRMIGEMNQGLLDFISDKINRATDMNNVRLRSRLPRLVDSMGENGYIAKANAEGKVSDQTYLSRFNINAEDEVKISEKNRGVSTKILKEQSKASAEASIEAQKIIDAYARKKRNIERIEAVKDQLAMTGVKNDELLRNMRAQKEMVEFQAKETANMMRLQEEAGKRTMGSQLSGQLKLLAEQLRIQTENIPRQMVAQSKGEIDATLLQQEAQEQMQEEQQYKEMDNFVAGLPEEEQQQIAQMSEEERVSHVQQLMETQMISNFADSLPPETQEELQQLPEEEQLSKLKGMMEQQQAEAAEAEQNPELAKEKQKAALAEQEEEKKKEQEEQEEIDNIFTMAEAYNKLNVEDREKYKEELMVEDTAKFSKMKTIADALVIRGYTAALINESEGNEEQIWAELVKSHPELVDDVAKSVNTQQQYQLQAKQYAIKLAELENNPEEHAKLIESINNDAPEEFKALIYSAYRELISNRINKEEMVAKMKKLEEEQKNMALNTARDIAISLKDLDPKVKEGYLANYRYEDPELYKLIMTQIGGE